MTADLCAFLRERLDEDETAAKQAVGWQTGSRYEGQPLAWVQHSERHAPLRVIAEVEAMREVVRLAERAHDYHETFMNGFASAMEGALRLYALPFAEHPDYRQEWRP